MKFCLRYGLKSEKNEDWKKKQQRGYNGDDATSENIKTSVGKQQYIFVARFFTLLGASEDELVDLIRAGLGMMLVASWIGV